MSAAWQHLPILQVILPLFGAIVAALLRRPGGAFALTLAISWIMPVIAGALLWQVLSGGPVSYHLGGWEPPWGIEYRVDLLNAFVLLLISVLGGGGIMGGMGSMMSGDMIGGGLFGMLFALLIWVLIVALIVALVVWIVNQAQRR